MAFWQISFYQSLHDILINDSVAVTGSGWKKPEMKLYFTWSDIQQTKYEEGIQTRTGLK